MPYFAIVNIIEKFHTRRIVLQVCKAPQTVVVYKEVPAGSGL